jgi:hypothetical protein
MTLSRRRRALEGGGYPRKPTFVGRLGPSLPWLPCDFGRAGAEEVDNAKETLGHVVEGPDSVNAHPRQR